MDVFYSLKKQKKINEIIRKSYDKVVQMTLSKIKYHSLFKKTNIVMKLDSFSNTLPNISNYTECTLYVNDRLNQLMIHSTILQPMLLKISWAHLVEIPKYDLIHRKTDYSNQHSSLQYEKLENRIKYLESNQDIKINLQKSFIKKPPKESKKKTKKQKEQENNDPKKNKKYSILDMYGE